MATFIISNHHEALAVWKNLDCKSRKVVHIDSHHDMYDYGEFPWIHNYLLYAIENSIVNEIVFVYPKHLFYSNDFERRFILTINSLKDFKKITNEKYELCIQRLPDKVTVCSLDIFLITYPSNNDFLVDIDLDYFIYNCLGAQVSEGRNYSFASNMMIDINKIKTFLNDNTIVTLSKSIYNDYVFFEHAFLTSLIAQYFNTIGYTEVEIEIKKIIDSVNSRQLIAISDMRFITPINDLYYLNACIAYSQNYKSLANDYFNRISGKTYDDVSIIPNHKFYLYNKNYELAFYEIQKYMIWFKEYDLYHKNMAQIYLAQNDTNRCLWHIEEICNYESNLKHEVLLTKAECLYNMNHSSEANELIDTIVYEIIKKRIKQPKEPVMSINDYTECMCFEKAIKMKKKKTT